MIIFTTIKHLITHKPTDSFRKNRMFIILAVLHRSVKQKAVGNTVRFDRPWNRTQTSLVDSNVLNHSAIQSVDIQINQLLQKQKVFRFYVPVRTYKNMDTSNFISIQQCFHTTVLLRSVKRKANNASTRYCNNENECTKKLQRHDMIKLV